MRGPLAGVSPFVAPILFCFQQAKEDLARHTANLTTDQVWAKPHGLTALGFHLKHIAGSVDRLSMYLQGLPLSDQQFAALHDESLPGAGLDELLNAIEQSFSRASDVVLRVNESELREPRGVGRERLPTTVIGLLVHLAEHTQRHVGQAISAAKLAHSLPQLDQEE